MKTPTLVLVICVLISGCTSKPMHLVEAKRNIYEFARQMHQERNLVLIREGGGLYDRVNSFSLTFYAPEYARIEEARSLFIYVSEAFQDQINKDCKIRPYLAKYPFTINSLDLSIIYPRISQEYNQGYNNGYVEAVGMANASGKVKYNLIIYAAYDESTDHLAPVHDESYQKALEIVRYQEFMNMPN